MKIRPTQASFVQTIHPLVVIKTRSERKEKKTKKNEELHTKRNIEEQ
jgi:hypothetical protein